MEEKFNRRVRRGRRDFYSARIPRGLFWFLNAKDANKKCNSAISMLRYRFLAKKLPTLDKAKTQKIFFAILAAFAAFALKQ